jgi:hypothetical protein
MREIRKHVAALVLSAAASVSGLAQQAQPLDPNQGGLPQQQGNVNGPQVPQQLPTDTSAHLKPRKSTTGRFASMATEMLICRWLGTFTLLG